MSDLGSLWFSPMKEDYEAAPALRRACRSFHRLSWLLHLCQQLNYFTFTVKSFTFLLAFGLLSFLICSVTLSKMYNDVIIVFIYLGLPSV